MKQKRKHPRFVLVSTRVEVKKFTKVRTYKRIRNGKIEKVKSHYRRY